MYRVSMQLTKERKILFSVLGLGLTALVADRLLLQGGGPQEAVASPTSPAKHASSLIALNTTNTSIQPATDAQTALIPTAVIADKLSAFDSSRQSVRDLTQIPAMWRPAKDPEPETSQVIQHLSFKQFEAEGHTVQAIVWEQTEPVVMIDGRALRVGDQIEGFKIVAIGERSLSLSPLPASHNKFEKSNKGNTRLLH